MFRTIFKHPWPGSDADLFISEPNLLHSIKCMKISASESIRNPQVAKEVFAPFKVSHIKIFEIVHRSLTVFARKRELKISLTGAL